MFRIGDRVTFIDKARHFKSQMTKDPMIIKQIRQHPDNMPGSYIITADGYHQDIWSGYLIKLESRKRNLPDWF